MIRRKLLSILAAVCLTAPIAATAVTPLDDPNTVVTVMQFSTKDATMQPEFKKRMAAMREYLRKQPGFIDNALYENRNAQSKPRQRR